MPCTGRGAASGGGVVLLAEKLRWQERGACRGDPELWVDPAMAPLAVHNCLTHCPVLDECREWAAGRCDWDAVVVAGVQWGSRHKGNAKPLAVKPQLCGDCVPPGHCVVCAEPIIGRPKQAKICHRRECANELASRRERARAGTRPSRPRRRCMVCRCTVPAGAPERQVLCGKEQCREVWQARQSRATSARSRQRVREEATV